MGPEGGGEPLLHQWGIVPGHQPLTPSLDIFVGNTNSPWMQPSPWVGSGIGGVCPVQPWEHQGELLPVPNANTWPCLSLSSGHWRLPGHCAQGSQSALDLQTGR